MLDNNSNLPDMAMDALKNLTNNIPDWLKRLDDLSGQIDKRQKELAELAALEGPKSAAEAQSQKSKSLRNKGSCESLKPKDDGPSPFSAPPDIPLEPAIPEDTPMTEPTTPPTDVPKQKPTSNTPPSPTALKQSREAVVAARARVRAQVRKRHRASSIASAEGTPAPYRTRSLIIVYYDSYVQGFFDELVRFVSSSRNLMRKAKMAARVAQIKRLAEKEVNEDDNSGDEIPSLRYMSSRRFGPQRGGFGPPRDDQPPDVYDKLDKGLDFVQSLCEHGAHQFLRDGDCNDEIAKVQKRLSEVLEQAAAETERVQREEPELAKETGELGKVRTRRPISMRREMVPAQKDGTLAAREEPKLEAADPGEVKPDLMEITKPLEVDTKMEADEGIDVEVETETPKFQYRSTRGYRTRRQ